MGNIGKKGAVGTAKRAVLYARVSGDDRGRDGRSLAGQLEMCREYAERQGWEIVAELAEDDRGASGAAFELEGLNQALEMAEGGEFDVLVPREIDRLSRNLAKQLIVEEELKRHNVEVEYALGDYPDTPEGRLNKHMRATIAEYEREKITERMVRGRRQKVKAGNVIVYGHPPYGYEVAQVDGKTMLIICEPEAKIVRMIFTWYVNGDGERGPLSITGITCKLTDLAVPTYVDTRKRLGIVKKKRERGEWSRSSVRNILKNEVYAGVWRYGKRNNRPAGRWVENSKDHALVVKVPAIVSREMWEAVQARLTENRKHRRCMAKHPYLLSRRVTCGCCGLKMAGSPTVGKRKVHLYYRCPAGGRIIDYARDCDAPRFRVDQVDAAVWDWLLPFFDDPKALKRGLTKYQAEQDKENAPIRERLAVVDDLVADNRSRLERLLDLYLAGDFPKEILTERKTRLKTTIAALEKERSGLVTTLGVGMLTDDQIQTIQEFAAAVVAGVNVAEADFENRRRVIEMLDVEATLMVENGEKKIRAQCRLGKEESLTCCPTGMML